MQKLLKKYTSKEITFKIVLARFQQFDGMKKLSSSESKDNPKLSQVLRLMKYLTLGEVLNFA